MIEAGRKERLNRRRDFGRPVAPCLIEESEHLLDEERVPLGRVGDLPPHVRRKLVLAQEIVDQRIGLRLRERLERERRRIELASTPIGSHLEKLGAGEAEEEDRRVPRPIGDMVDEIEERRLGPMEILEDDDQWTLARERLEQLPHRPEGLLRRPSCRGPTDRGVDPRGDRVGLAVVAEERDERQGRIVCCEVLDDLAERPERDALAVRKASSGDDPGASCEHRAQLRRESRLPNPRRSEDREEVIRLVLDRPVERHP